MNFNHSVEPKGNTFRSEILYKSKLISAVGGERKMTPAKQSVGGSALVEVFDGTGELWSGGPILIRVLDGNHRELSSEFHDDGRVRFLRLPLQNNFADDYTFVASADGHRDAGFFPVKLVRGVEPVV